MESLVPLSTVYFEIEKSGESRKKNLIKRLKG
jgi:hypothetical protein